MDKVSKIVGDEIKKFLNEDAGLPQFGDRLHLDEYGEASSEPYEYEFDSISWDEINYHFVTEDGDPYIVIAVNTDRTKNVWELEFGVEGGHHSDVINKGRIFNVMATIQKITNDLIERVKPNVLKFKPSKSKGEDDNRRYHMYMSYIRKNMRNDYVVVESPPYIILDRKIKTQPKTTIHV